MDQNPNYFPGYYTANRKIDVQVMDRLLLERCTAWIFANDEITREAAFDEYVDTVISLVELDGTDPRHRHDVQEQALSTINVLVNEQGRSRSLNTNQEIRVFMREQFLIRMSARFFDRKYGNSYGDSNPEVDKRRTQLRNSFQTVLDVDPTLIAFPSDMSNIQKTEPQEPKG